MSQLLINAYLADLDRLKKASGSKRESVIREAFKDLLKAWGRSQGLQFIPEHEYITTTKERRYIDGALLHDLRVPFGYWEAKDSNDDLDDEIAKKFKRGYPQTNIIFEDSTEAVLIQNRQEVMRCSVTDVDNLEKLLELFFGYQRPEIADFRKAIEQFKQDLPEVLKALRARIDDAYAGNKPFVAAARDFLKQAQDTINPAVTDADIREMLIQHILTEDIFARVFGLGDFHRENNVAKALYKLEQHFFRGDVKQKTLAALEPYYAAIRSTAALIQSHSEKQGFLKAIYENFYKVYNPKAADRLGVVYTPHEIVRFMVEGADWLCEKHFGKTLIDRNVEILDPAVGTGTFIVELLEHFRGRPKELKYKYENELHANEVAILPYYVANLNIEATYAAIMNDYNEFPNLCFVDTLDNVAGLKASKAVTGDLFGAMSEENVERIRRQNKRKISVIIGNPPYNANQQNENENNKNREYPEIDRRIKATYIAASTAQKTKLYDMYSRFFRWASDRIEDDGIVAFVTNRSFLESRTFDGFRKVITEEFNEIYVLDLGGDVRANPKLSGTKHNVFGIQTGVAISFLIKHKGAHGCQIFYGRRPEFETAEDKLTFLLGATIKDGVDTTIQPDPKNNWLNITANDFDQYLPIANKETKAAERSSQERAIFKLFSLGVVTNRDEWVYDIDKNALMNKIDFQVDHYADALSKVKALPKGADVLPALEGSPIKWTRHLKKILEGRKTIEKMRADYRTALYRPFTIHNLYFSYAWNEVQYQTPLIWPSPEEKAQAICFTVGGRLDFSAFATDHTPSLTVLSLDANQCLPRVYFSDDGAHVDNITDWALTQFTTHYGDKAKITKDDIFAYVYAVLHDPIYREKYALNLKREFPRIPFYENFRRWRDWGQELLDLHIGYESATPFGLKRTDTADEKARAAGQAPKAILKSDHDTGVIMLDSETQLGGVPAEAWRYMLGNRCAIDWVLDQHKEKTPKDPTIREKFNTYRFADHKEKTIDLLQRVTTVSVETVTITDAMRKAPR
ncbi:type ISP restriction/modification enzyme [Ferrovibrio xuzhouensis]|uniref:site-specific DNA-methyltransferase (adenine-specific) n=1 Tax=Ferrovibrio xuzhouensis TaxID=1576914 RepID=A0ABV7VHX8_9PROT